MPEFKNQAKQALESFTLICSICGCHVSLLSKITPRYLTLLVRGILLWLTITSKFVEFCIALPIIMKLLFL